MIDNNNVIDVLTTSSVAAYIVNYGNESTNEIVNMFPISKGHENQIIVIAIIYGLLFIFGICGNVSIITLIRHAHRCIRYDTTITYVLFLCWVDLASLLPLPMTMIDLLVGYWTFGTLACKLYRLGEHVGRALSTFVLAAMAFDRYVGVCRPHWRRGTMSTRLQLGALTTFTALLTPLLIHAASEEIILHEVLLKGPPMRLARVRIFKCVDNLDEPLMTIFVMYMFTVGFAIPVTLIAGFYSMMLRELFIRSKRIPKSQVPVNRIAVYTMAIALFFIVCFTPYWMAILMSLRHDDTDQQHQLVQQTGSSTFVYVMYGIHALPYFNSASNWLFYGMLNRQLHRRAAASSSSMAPNRVLISMRRDNNSNLAQNVLPRCSIYREDDWSSVLPLRDTTNLYLHSDRSIELRLSLVSNYDTVI